MNKDKFNSNKKENKQKWSGHSSHGLRREPGRENSGHNPGGHDNPSRPSRPWPDNKDKH